MFKKSGATRLGDILVSKGLISSEQLKHAIKEQTSRRKTLDPDNAAAQQATSLGEILIELGYIDRLQLKRGLNWQLVLRKATMAMALCAPLLSFSTGAVAAIAKSVLPIPAKIEAENYTTQSGILVEASTDVGAGKDIGNINAGDWLNYANTAISVPVAGNYVISYRVASLRGGGSFTLNEVGTSTTVIDTVVVPKTDGWQTWVTVQRTVSLKAGLHYFSINALTAGFNLNWFTVEATTPVVAASVASSSAVSSVASSASSVSSKSSSSIAASVTPVSSAASSAPAVSSSSTPAAVSSSSTVSSAVSSAASSAAPTSNLPLTIQAETYATMSGIETETTSDTGGGLNVGYIDSGDWMSYENTTINIPATGQYTLSYRVASGGGGGSFNLYETGNNIVYDTVTVGSTGGWQTWVTIQRVVTLTAGKHTLGLKAVSGGFNINWFKVESAGATTSSSSTAATTSSSSSSAPSVTSSSLSSSSKSSAASSTGSTSTSGVVSTVVAGPVGMSWIPPSKRLDGTVLDITEVGGYEIRYKLASATDFTYISIADAFTTQYNFSWLEGTYVFQVAAFDKNGVYSNFVDVVSN